MKATPMLFALATVVVAQNAGDTSADAPPGPEVSGFEWKYGGHAPSEVVRGEKTADSVRTARGTDYVFKYASLLTLSHLTKGRQKIPVAGVEFEDGTARRAGRPEGRKP